MSSNPVSSSSSSSASVYSETTLVSTPLTAPRTTRKRDFFKKVMMPVGVGEYAHNNLNAAASNGSTKDPKYKVPSVIESMALR